MSVLPVIVMFVGLHATLSERGNKDCQTIKSEAIDFKNMDEINE
jgi:hypothetical protein